MDRKIIPIEKLLVNPKNPRFEPVKSQQEAINLMLIKVGKEVFNLAKDIAEHGLNPSKSLMVLEVADEYFLPLEGNRRVVALKLLHEPEQTTNQIFIQQFKELKKDYGSKIPSEIECTVFPDKESAFRWVNLEHTGRNKGVGVLDWNYEQLQRFIAEYTGKIASREVQLLDFAKQNKIDHSKIDLSTLERLVSTESVREQIGISFPNGILNLEKSNEQVIMNLTKVFKEMSQPKFAVEQVYTVDKRKKWIRDVLGILEEKEEKEKQKTISKKGDPLDGDWISARLHSAYVKQDRVKAILGELRDINPKQKPNICASSLRVLLELATYIFLKNRGEIQAIIKEEKEKFKDENRKRTAKGLSLKEWNNEWSPNFQRMLSCISKNDKLMTEPNERTVLQTFITKKSNEPFLTELNLFIHNPDYEPSPESITEIWNKLGKLVFKTIGIK